MLNNIIHSAHLAIGMLPRYIADIDPAKLTYQPYPGANHPVWIVGHLASAMNSGTRMLGVESPTPESWGPLFGGGSQPVDDPSKYPSMKELLEAYEHAGRTLIEALSHATPAKLSEPVPSERFRKICPTLGDAAVFMLTVHNGMHIGQLTAWRRALNMPGIMG